MALFHFVRKIVSALVPMVQKRTMRFRLIGYSKWPVGVSVNGCMSLSPVMNSRLHPAFAPDARIGSSNPPPPPVINLLCLVGWFVISIMPKLLDGFKQNLVGERRRSQVRTLKILGWIHIKG